MISVSTIIAAVGGTYAAYVLLSKALVWADAFERKRDAWLERSKSKWQGWLYEKRLRLVLTWRM